MEISTIRKSTETKADCWLPGGWEEGNESDYLMGTGFRGFPVALVGKEPLPI